MDELEHADAEVQTVHELHVERDRLINQLSMLTTTLDERSSQIMDLKSKLLTLEQPAPATPTT